MIRPRIRSPELVEGAGQQGFDKLSPNGFKLFKGRSNDVAMRVPRKAARCIVIRRIHEMSPCWTAQTDSRRPK
jgi:hypothetical protein